MLFNGCSCCFFWNVSKIKLILFLKDLNQNIRAEFINVVFCYQSLLPENHVLPEEAATKYQGIVGFLQS